MIAEIKRPYIKISMSILTRLPDGLLIFIGEGVNINLSSIFSRSFLYLISKSFLYDAGQLHNFDDGGWYLICTR